VKIISHRGNLDGENLVLENSPSYIEKAISSGYDVEIDIWYLKNDILLGHDKPQYKIDNDWLNKNKPHLWIHCKNTDILNHLFGSDFNYFWHNSDTATLTSKGFIWCLPNIFLSNGITVCNKFSNVPNIYGVCTDEPHIFKSNMGI